MMAQAIRQREPRLHFDLDLLPVDAKSHRHVGTGGLQLKRLRA